MWRLWLRLLVLLVALPRRSAGPWLLRAAQEDRLDDVPPDILIRHYGNLVKIRAAHQRVPDSIAELDNWWYYGDTGTGKSWTARRENPGYYIKNKNRWWDGYWARRR